MFEETSPAVSSSMEATSGPTAKRPGGETTGAPQANPLFSNRYNTLVSEPTPGANTSFSAGTQAGDTLFYNGSAAAIDINAKLEPIAFVERTAGRYIAQTCEQPNNWSIALTAQSVHLGSIPA